MAYAELAGLPAVAGLYALLLPTVAYTFLGSSRQLIVGPEGSLSALVAAAVLALATAGSPEALELAGAADSLNESQLAAWSGPSPPRRTSPTSPIQTASLDATAEDAADHAAASRPLR